MLTQTVVEDIRRLLADDQLSHRKIAQLTGVCRGTIGAIAAGKAARLPATPPRPPGRSAGARRAARTLSRLRRHGLSSLPLLPGPQPGGAPRRPAAGRRQEPAGELLTLQLKEEHRRRYEEIHAQRLEEYQSDFVRK